MISIFKRTYVVLQKTHEAEKIYQDSIDRLAWRYVGGDASSDDKSLSDEILSR